ncbi:MAG: guanylate kinase [Candidatus Hydrogenedentota bacterium]
MILVVSAPSGAGKQTVLSQVRKRDPSLGYIVSVTTRPPRPDEREGVEYRFVSEETFQAQIEAGVFAEWAEVHGNYYGTPLAELQETVAAGRDAVLEIDVQGMRQIKQSSGEPVTAFIMPPSLNDLRERLARRGADEPSQMALRLANAREEMAAWPEFHYVIVNDILSEAVTDLEAIIRAERRRTVRMEMEQGTR